MRLPRGGQTCSADDRTMERNRSLGCDTLGSSDQKSTVPPEWGALAEVLKRWDTLRQKRHIQFLERVPGWTETDIELPGPP